MVAARTAPSERVPVEPILADVQQRGDAALLDVARRFDAPGLASLALTAEERGPQDLPAPHRDALVEAAKRIRRFHEAQRDRLFGAWDRTGYGWRWMSGSVGQIARPLARAGVYVPGGRAAYPSSVLMNVIPAQVAGVAEIVVCTPSGPDGKVPAAVCEALRLVEVEVVKVGGAAAVAAMAFGTESVRAVEKIVGPGSTWVNEAKRHVFGVVGIDSLPGPSEVCVLFDDSAHPDHVAADFLAQLEHAPDNAGFLVALSERALERALEAIEKQLENAPRAEIMRAAQGWSFVSQTIEEAYDAVRLIAPEHLSVAIAEPELALLPNAGCMKLGEFTPESYGDWLAGPSHTLPTSGAARFGSPLNIMDFIKFQSVIEESESGLREALPTLRAFAEMEGFPQHLLSAEVRFSD